MLTLTLLFQLWNPQPVVDTFWCTISFESEVNDDLSYETIFEASGVRTPFGNSPPYFTGADSGARASAQSGTQKVSSTYEINWVHRHEIDDNGTVVAAWLYYCVNFDISVNQEGASSAGDCYPPIIAEPSHPGWIPVDVIEGVPQMNSEPYVLSFNYPGFGTHRLECDYYSTDLVN